MRRATLAALVLAAACTSSTEPAPGSTVRRPLRVEQNVVRVSITSSGTATVRVLGRKMPGSSDLVLVRLVSVDP